MHQQQLHDRRSDAGHIRVAERDLELLRVVGEQFAITLPQLARLMGRSGHAARWLRARWQRAGWVEGRALLVGEPVVVWLTVPPAPRPPAHTCALSSSSARSGPSYTPA